MANFGDWKKLPSLSTKNGSPSVKYIASKKSLLCTTGQKHVDLCSAEDGRSNHTWSVRQTQQLTSPAVFDPTKGDFLVVLNIKTLYRWSETTDDILKGQKTQLETNVYTLAQCGIQEPLLLYEDGRISRCSAPKDFMCEGHNKKILWADIIKHGRTNVLCQIIKGSNSTEAVISRARKNSPVIHQQTFTLNEEHCGQYCLQHKDQFLSLLTLSAGGNMHKYALTVVGFGEQEKVDTSGEVKENALLYTLDDSHIVVTQTREDKDGGLGIAIWDLKFSAMKAWCAYPMDGKGAPSYLTVINDSLFVGGTSGIYMRQCSMTPSTLGSVLGSVTPTSISVLSITSLETFIEPLLDRSKTRDYASFKMEFTEFSRALKDNMDETILIQQKLYALVKRCLEEKMFFPETELLHLVSENLVPAKFCMSTVQKLQESDNVAGVHSCLINIKDIPESVTVECLQYFLGMDASKFPSVTDEEMSEENEEQDRTKNECPLLQAKAAFVNRVLMIPFSEVFLLESMKKLEFDKCIVLLDYLRYLLASLPEESSKKNNNWAELFQEKVVNWLCVVLDAHFTQMIISPDAGRILIDIQEIVEARMSYYGGLVDLENMIYHFLQKVNVPKKKHTGDYCIEKLVFR